MKAATRAAERVKLMEDLKQQVTAAVQAERKRIVDLNALKCKNAAVNKIIDLAITEGKEISEIQPYLDAVKSAEQTKDTKRPHPPQGGSGVPDSPQVKMFNQLRKFIF